MNTDTSIAQTILQQMGGTGRISAMTGAKQFIALPNGVTFRIGRGANKSINLVKVTLNGLDLYDVTFSRFRNMKVKDVVTVNDVFNDQLKGVFERETGMFLSL